MLLCSNPLFSLGQMVATPHALELLAQHNTSCFSLLARHQSGDWGNVPAEFENNRNFYIIIHLARLNFLI